MGTIAETIQDALDECYKKEGEMKVAFNKACFLDYTSEKEVKIDEIVQENHEYLFRFNNSGSLTHVYLVLSYIGNLWYD
jgi:hypothetical protein